MFKGEYVKELVTKQTFSVGGASSLSFPIFKKNKMFIAADVRSRGNFYSHLTLFFFLCCLDRE